MALAVEAFVAAGLADEAQAIVASARSHQGELGLPFLEKAEGRALLAQGDFAQAQKLLAAAAQEAAARGFRLVEWRARLLAAEALAQLGSQEETAQELAAVAGEAHSASAVLILKSPDITASSTSSPATP